MYCQQLIAKVSLGTQRHEQPGAVVVSGKDTTRYSLLRLIAVCAVVLACSDATSTTSSSASTSSSSTRTFTRTGSHTMSSTTTGTTSRTVSRSHPSRSTSASLSRSMPTSQSAGFISLTRSSSPTYSHNSQTATGTSATVSATHSFTKQSGTFSTIPSPTRGTISTTVSLSSSPSNPSQSPTEGTSPTKTPTARPTMSQSLSYSGSRSAHTLAPWILAVDSTAPTSGTQVALMPDIVASFALAVQSDSSDGAAIERHLTILPNAVDPAGSPWAHQCRQGLPNLFNSPLSIPSGTATTVEVELVYSLTSALLNTSSGHTFLICTSDGYFSGVVVHRMASGVLQVVADDGGTFPTDRTLVLPATGGQVAAWSILYTVTFSISDASALAALAGSGSPVYAVDDAVASSDGCTFGSRVATFNAVQANATALRVTLSSDALSVVPVAAKTLRLCFRGTSVLNVTLQLLHNLTLNGAPLHATQVVSLLGGAHAVVAPLTMAATTASNVLTIATLGLILTTTCMHTNNTGASLAPLTQTINSSQSFALTLSGASGYVDLCLALPSVPALDGRLTAARVFTPTSSALDNIVPQTTASNRTAVALFVGSYADVAWTGSWNLSYATAAQQAAMLSHARVFIGALVGSTVSPVDGSLATATPTGNATSWTIAVPSDWSALSGQADGAYVCWHTATATSTTSAMVALTQYSVTAVRIAHVGRNLNRPRTIALSGETNVVLQATQHNASTSMAFGAEASHLYVGAVVSNRCVSLSSAVIGVSAAVAATAVALSQGLVLHGSSGVVEGLFCVGRTNQSAYAATENRYTVAAFGALGNATHQLQLMHLPNGGVGASASDLADGTRSVTVSLSNIAANASDDMTQLVVLPCSTSDGSRIALTLHAAATFGGTARVSAVWASGANTLLASAQVALCWTAANASVTAVPPTDYYTNGAPLLPWGAALHTVPLVPTVVEHVLLGGAASQTFPLTFAAAWSLVYPMVVVFGAAASGTQCNTTAMRLLPTGGFATNASNTSISVTMSTSGLSALEPTAVLCMGVVNALTALASSVYYTLPFNVATLLMVRYNIMDETSTEMAMFPATTPTNAIAYLYQFTTTAVLVEVVLADTSLLTTSSGAGGLTLTLATSSVSSCASTNNVVASWNQGTNLSATVATSIASVASDTFFLCAKLTSAINALNGYAWTKLSLRTVGVASIDTTLSPLSYKSSAGVAGAPATALTAMSTMASAVRLLTVQGQHFDTTSDWVLRMYTLAGADCEATAPDLTATSSTTSSSALIFSVPAVSTPLLYRTVCARFTVQSTQVFVYLHLQLRILSFATVGVSASSISDRQLGIVAVANFAVNLTLYAPSGSAVVDISGIQLYASNASSCGRGSAIQEVFAALYALPLSIGADGGAVVSLSGLSSTGTYYLCYSTLATSARRWATMAASSAEPVGVTISTIDLKLSGYTLGSNNSIGSLVNSTLELKATGALLSTALVYVSVTDTACTAAALTGTTAFGNSRVPSLFTGCSGSASSVTLSAATQITGNSPMTVCLGFGSVLDASSLSSAPILTYVDSGLRLAVVQPDDLYIIQNQSAVVSYLGTLDRQPIVGMRDGTSNVALAIVPSSTVLRAEWIATSPVVQDTGEVYTFTSGDADSSFDFSTSSSQIQLRNGKFGFKYVLKFSVPSGASSYHAVNSSETELDSCQSSLQWAKWFTSTCTTCPDNAICDGSATFRVSGSYWRYSEYSPYLYSCSSPYMGDTCTSNTTVGTCTAGHTGPRCSVCLPGYGLASDQCTDCAGNEILHAFIVFLAAFVMVLVLVVLVISTLQCKKSDQFPIYFKLLINHLTAASTLGEFSQYLTSSLVTLFKIQRQASRPSPAFAALTCSLGLSWYQQFILVVSFPGFAAFALIAFFSVKQMVSECKMRYKLAHSNAFADSSKLDKSGDGGKSRRRQTALFFTRPNNNAKDGSAHDDFLTMENVDRVNSIQVGEDDAPPRLEDMLPAVSGGGSTPSVTRTTGVIRRRLNQRKPTQVSASFAPSQEGEDGTVKESLPSPAVEPLEEPTGAAHDFSDHPLEAPAAFDLDAPSGEAPPAQQAVRNGSTRSTSGVAVNFSIKDIRLAVSTQDEGGEPDVNGGEDENEDQDETEMEDAQDPNKLKRRMTVELGLMEVHGAVARAKMNHLFAVVMVIVMFAAYPSVLEWCANVLRCDEMDIGEAQIDGTIASNLQSYFFYDRSKLCTSSEHSRYVVAGITLGMLYGFGTPLCAVALYYRLKRAKSLGGVGYIDASRMFTFLIAGYRRDVWWWEAAVMFRKMVLIYIASFMQDAQQQTLCAFWTICAYLLAHVVVRPYEYETVDRMERYSLLVICLTLNFSLAFSWLDDRDTVAREFGYWSLSIFLFVINVGVVLWMLWEIVLEGTIKVQKFLFLNSALVHEKLHPRLAQCVMAFAYKPPEMVEILPDGQMIDVYQHDVAIPQDEQQAFIDAEDSGSDWSDDEEFQLEDDAVHQVTPTNDALRLPRSGEAAVDLQLSRAVTPEAAMQGGATPGAVANESSFVAFPATPGRGSLRNKLKSMGSIFGFRRGGQPQQQSAGSNMLGSVSPSEAGFVATAAAQEALAHLETAVAARSENVVSKLRAIIEGMQAHSEALITKYTTLKHTLSTKTTELEACKKRCDGKPNMEEEVRNHVQRLSELEEMAAELRDENESLKDQLQRLTTSYDRSSSPTNNQRLVETLRHEREDLIQRLARQEMEFGGGEHDGGHGGGSPLQLGASAQRGSPDMDQRLRDLALEAEAESVSAQALAEAEREAQLQMIEAQLKAKREARMRRVELGLPPTAPVARRKSHVNDLVDRITFGNDDDEETPPQPPNPFTSTMTPRGSVDAPSPRRSQSRFGNLAERLESAMRDAFQGRPGTRQGGIVPSRSGGGGSHVSFMTSGEGAPEVFNDQRYTAVEEPDSNRVLVIKRKHPKMRPPEFVAPWGHATWSKEEKKAGRRHA